MSVRELHAKTVEGSHRVLLAGMLKTFPHGMTYSCAMVSTVIKIALKMTSLILGDLSRQGMRETLEP